MSSKKPDVRDPAYSLRWDASNTLFFPVTEYVCGEGGSQFIDKETGRTLWDRHAGVWNRGKGEAYFQSQLPSEIKQYMTTYQCKVH